MTDFDRDFAAYRLTRRSLDAQERAALENEPKPRFQPDVFVFWVCYIAFVAWCIMTLLKWV
jgi:hypothetical protein